MPAIMTRDFCISSNHDAPEKRVVASSTRREGELRGRGLEVCSVGGVGKVGSVGNVGSTEEVSVDSASSMSPRRDPISKSSIPSP